MEIDLSSVGRFKETETLFRKELGDTGVQRALMEFQNAASTASIILKLAARRVKRVPN
jgi:hypothetical protein